MEPTKRIDSLFERISALIEQARGYVVNSVKIAEVKTRYEVGRYIYEDEQQGERVAYGELIDNQVPYGYVERYKFTGKERDWETGYDYFGARYWWLGGTWLSVDPLADKYPNISPYAYAAWNPVKYIDPDGREITITGEDGITITYVPGENYEGNNGFTKDTYTKLNQLNDMFSNTDFMSSIVNSHDIYNISSKESMVEGTHSFKDGVINIGTTCSIDGIGHELFHAYQDTKGQGGASIHNEVEAYLFQTKILYTMDQGIGSTPLTAAERRSSSTFSNALNTLMKISVKMLLMQS